MTERTTTANNLIDPVVFSATLSKSRMSSGAHFLLLLIRKLGGIVMDINAVWCLYH